MGARPTPLLFAPVVLLAACSGGDATADRLLATLVPKDAVVYVRLTSLDDVVETIRANAATLGAPTQMIGVDPMLAPLGPMAGDTTLIDRRRAIAFALVAPRATQPTPVVFVPATDAAKYAASLQQNGLAAVADGGYVVVPLAGKYSKPEQPSALCEAMPDGLIVARVDVEKTAQNLGTVIGAGLTAFKAMMTQEMSGAESAEAIAAVADLYIGAAQAILGSGRTLDIAADAPGGQLEVTARLQAKAGSALDGWSSPAVDLSPYAGVLTGKGAVDAVSTLDWKVLWPKFAPMMDTLFDIYPPAVRAPMRELMQGYVKLYDTIGPVLALEATLAPDGRIGVLGHLAPPNVPAWFAAVDEMVGWPQLAKVGVTITPHDSEGADGAAVRDYRMAIDPQKLPGGGPTDAEWDRAMGMVEKLFGQDGLQLRFASKEQRVAFGLGHRLGDVAPSLGTSGGSWPKAIRPAMAFVGDCNPMFVERLDFAALFGLMKAMEPAMVNAPTLPAGAAADVVIAFGIRGAEWRASFGIDLVGLGEVVLAMRPR